MGPLLLLGLCGISNIGAGVALNRATLADDNLKPRIWGADARHVGIGLGLVGALLGGPIGAAIGLGLVSASVVNIDTGNQVQKGLEAYIRGQIEMQAQAAAAALPAPASPVPQPLPRQPAALPGGPALPGALLNTFAQLFQPAAA